MTTLALRVQNLLVPYNRGGTLICLKNERDKAQSVTVHFISSQSINLYSPLKTDTSVFLSLD